ncbi:MAG: hypothetical protein HYV37_00360 [Candidatus Levyibacteriota bacterium]|nr:MAG: hypothetical protein HYV37_00360 [Candidatus Levybacteria bacterium]
MKIKKKASSKYSFQKGFSPIIIVVIAFVVLLGGVFIYSVSKNPAVQKQVELQKSLQNTSQDIPKGNAHWDKSQDLFSQMKKETDTEKIKKLNDQAIQELKAVLDEMPNNARVWDELGNAYTWVSSLDPKAQLDLGLAAYKKAEELDSNNTVYINAVGDQLISMQRYDEAILQFQKTLRLTPNSGYANLSLCNAYKGAKVYDSARESCQKAIDIFTNENKDGKYDSQVLEAKKAMAGIPK